KRYGKLGTPWMGTGQSEQPGVCGQTSKSSSPKLGRCRTRFRVRLTTPSILGRKTSETMATRMAPSGKMFSRGASSRPDLAGQDDRDVVPVVDREEELVQQQPGEPAGGVQTESLDERRQPAAAVGELQEPVEVAELQRRLERLAGDD